MTGLDYVTIPLTPIPEEQVVFVEGNPEQEGWCCRNVAGWAIGVNVVVCSGLIAAIIYGFVWIVKTYP